jgi:hypothetical protein
VVLDGLPGPPVNEAYLKSRLVAAITDLEPRAICFRHEDKFVAGVPDMAVILARTAWIEGKVADPQIKGLRADKSVGKGWKAVQEMNMLLIAAAGSPAWYVVWRKSPFRETVLVHPRDVRWWDERGERRPGYDHEWVRDRVLEALRK